MERMDCRGQVQEAVTGDGWRWLVWNGGGGEGEEWTGWDVIWRWNRQGLARREQNIQGKRWGGGSSRRKQWRTECWVLSEGWQASSMLSRLLFSHWSPSWSWSPFLSYHSKMMDSSPWSSLLGCWGASLPAWSTYLRWIMCTGTWLLGTFWSTATWCAKCPTLASLATSRMTPQIPPTLVPWWVFSPLRKIMICASDGWKS